MSVHQVSFSLTSWSRKYPVSNTRLGAKRSSLPTFVSLNNVGVTQVFFVFIAAPVHDCKVNPPNYERWIYNDLIKILVFQPHGCSFRSLVGKKRTEKETPCGRLCKFQPCFSFFFRSAQGELVVSPKPQTLRSSVWYLDLWRQGKENYSWPSLMLGLQRRPCFLRTTVTLPCLGGERKCCERVVGGADKPAS